VPYSHSPPAPRIPFWVAWALHLYRTTMANIASQKKRIARTARERAENQRFAGAVKTHMKRLEKAVASGDDAGADAEHKQLISRVDKAIQKGAMHKNTGARKKARAARVRSGKVEAAPPKAAKPKREPQAEAEAPEAEAPEAEAEEPADK
jgi:small subunit ribosomal protein S20